MDHSIMTDHAQQLQLPSLAAMYSKDHHTHKYHAVQSREPSSFSLPKPQPGRLPVRLGLSDPRVHIYLNPPKPMSAPSHDRSQDSTLLRQGHVTLPQSRSTHSAAPTSRYPPMNFVSSSRLAPSRSSIDIAQPIRRDFELYGSTATSPRKLSHGHYAHGSTSGNGNVLESGPGAYSRSSTVPSTSPSPLPSPAPSATLSPDWHLTCNRQHHSHAQQQESQLDLLSPSSSEADLGSDTRTMPPLFSSSPPPLFPSELHASRLSPQPMVNSLSRSSNISSGSSNPSLENQAALTLPNNQSHHKLPPIRAPERAGQEVIKTSSLDTTSSEYLNMDYYSIYRQNPRLLRPEGGRFDERRHHTHAHSHSEDVTASITGDQMHHISHLASKTKPKPRMTADSTGLSRRQSMPLISTGTSRILRHEDAKMETLNKPSYNSSQDLVRSLGIHSAVSRSRPSKYHPETHSAAASSTRPVAMSIHHLLSDDSSVDMPQSDRRFYYPDNSSVSIGSESGSDSGIKRKKAHENIDDEKDGEPKKRRRMSKKRAAELGLLDEDGNFIKKRKRTKKIQDPDHVSASGFRHGGERTVQEPEEVVTLGPDVGPISLLDVKQPPMVVWKGQPLSVAGKPGYELLHPHEARIASTLRLSPAQYLNCKQTLILASRAYLANPDGKQFRKSDAQKLCRIDVNKTSRLWEVFAKIGWLAGITEKDI
ncbi:hypothetical protein BGZ79_000049 [Entomortierella chlamydospora]|nr:hypothetical protein BGZ79_000049 [Entomortierella chlamydospora]